MTLVLILIAIILAGFACRQLAPRLYHSIAELLNRVGVKDEGTHAQETMSAPPLAMWRPPAGTSTLAVLRTPVRGAAIAVAVSLLAVLVDVVFAARTPVHVHVESVGIHGTLVADGATHTFTWPRIPRTVSLPPNIPYIHEWGIDGSETLNAGMNNLDPTYLQSIQSNPYVALDRWLRGEDGYDKWQAVRVVNKRSGRLVAAGDAATFTTPVAVPSHFVLDADVLRLEEPVTVRFGVPGGAYTLHLDRVNRSLSISNDTSPNAPPLGQWYFPNDPMPYLAINVATLIHAVLWAAVLLLLTTALGACVPLRLTTRIEPTRRILVGRAVLLLGLVLALGFALMLYMALGEYSGMPHVGDTHGYFFQAKMFAAGRLSLPPPPLIDSFPIPFFGVVNGHWVSQYGPGAALILVPGILLGAPWLVQPLLGLGALALVGATARRLYGTWVALLAVLLGALSPFFLFQIGTYFSHPQAAFFVALSLYFFVRSGCGEHPWTTALAGAALGMAALCREFDGVLVSLPLTAALLLHTMRRDRAVNFVMTAEGQGASASVRAPKHQIAWRTAQPIAAWIGGALPFGALYLLYDWHITGNPLQSVRSIVDPTDRLGFGPGHGWWATHTLAAGLVNMDQLVTGVNLALFGWPYDMALAVPLIPFVLGRADRWDLLNAGVVLSIAVGYIAYFYHGVAIGPRYYYATIPSLLLLSARGLTVLGDTTGALLVLWRRNHLGGPIAAHAILLIFIAANVTFYLPRHFYLYRHYANFGGSPALRVTRLYSAPPPHAIVVTSDFITYLNGIAALNNPRDFIAPTVTDDTMWALASDPARYKALLAAYPHRALYILSNDGTNVTFTPWSATHVK